MANHVAIVAIVLSFSLLSVCADAAASKRSEESCGTRGTCLPKTECFSLHSEQNSMTGAFLFSCGEQPDWVCCPLLQSPRVMFKQSQEVNKDLLPLEECGRATESRISGGTMASLGQFPWMALIGFRLNNSSDTLDYQCGGTLISNRYVLSAAHCFTHAIPVSVRLGEHDLSQSEDCDDDYCADPPVDVSVEEVVSHKDYNKPYLKNDIALLRLSNTVSSTDYIFPICLPFGMNITGDERKKYVVAGWGKVSRTNHKSSDHLLHTRVLSSPVSECNKEQPREVRPIGRLQLCAGDLGVSDVCKGDSGGPMMTTKVEDNTIRTYQIGIVSFGYTSCGGIIPSVYTRVTAYLAWIVDNLKP